MVKKETPYVQNLKTKQNKTKQKTEENQINERGRVFQAEKQHGQL